MSTYDLIHVRSDSAALSRRAAERHAVLTALAETRSSRRRVTGTEPVVRIDSRVATR